MKLVSGLSREVLFFRFAWFAYFVATLVGARTRYLAWVLIPISVLCWFFSRDRKDFFRVALSFSESLENSKTLRWIMQGILLLSVAVLLLSSYFSFAGLEQRLYDWGTYFQANYNDAFHGEATLTPNDMFFDSKQFHTTIGLPILTALFRFIPHPASLIAWHGIFLVAPAFLFIYGMRRVLRESGLPQDPVAETLLVLVFLLSPVFSGNAQWPYVWHTAGILFYALAYLAYWRGSLGLCFFALGVFSLHKEEFGLFSAFFAGPILLDSRFSIRKRLAWATTIFAAGVGYYVWAVPQTISPFSARFGNLGNTPREAIVHLFTDPMRYIHVWTSELSLRFISFFLVGSLWFIAPTRRAFLLGIPVLPFLFLYAASEYDTMRQFRHHYALPLGIAFFSVLIFAVLPAWIARFSRKPDDPSERYLPRVLLLSVLCASALWAQGTPFLDFRRAVRAYSSHREDRNFLAPLRLRRDEVICCDFILCSYLADRPVFLLTEVCTRGSKILAELGVKRVGLLVHPRTDDSRVEVIPGLPRVVYPEEWEYRSDYLAFSWVEVIQPPVGSTKN